MDKLTDALKNFKKYIIAFVKWIAVAAVTGVLGGVLGSLFHHGIDYVTELRGNNSWMIYLLPLGGVLIALMYRMFTKKGALDTNRVIESVREGKKVPFVMIPLIFVSTIITHALGGSAGREGAALQLGGGIGYNLGRLFKFKKNDMRIIVMSGMSAVFAALFGTPLTAAVFSLEVTNVGILHYAGLLPCIISSVIAAQIAKAFGLHPVHFIAEQGSAFTISLTLKVIILAVLCALVSILFCLAIKRCEHLFDKLIKNDIVRAFSGGVLIVALTVLVGSYDYNGAGMDVVARAIGGDAKPLAFLLKIIFTAITISAGFKGGEIVPAFFIGSTFGCAIAPVLGMDASFAASLGLICLFCGVVNCPIASIILALELFGAEGLLYFAIACAVSYMMSGSFGLYHSQKILYSKVDDEYIDMNTI